MGGEGGAGRSPAEVTAGLRAAYEAAAGGWAAGPERVYAPLARALVLAAPVPVTGCRVLDLGAGTGLAGRAALAAGADRVASADLAVAMLRLTGPAQHPVAADAVALPFRDRSFDLVVAAFCLNHLDRPGDVLGEVRRVGRALAASTFAPGWTHPAKLAVDQGLRPFGYEPPAWYGSSEAASASRACAPSGSPWSRHCSARSSRAAMVTSAVPWRWPISSAAACRSAASPAAPRLRSTQPLKLTARPAKRGTCRRFTSSV